MKTKVKNNSKSIIASLVLFASLGGIGFAHADEENTVEWGYVWYKIEKDTSKYLIEQIKTVSPVKNNSYVIETINGYKITNSYTKAEKAKSENADLKNGKSIDIIDCARPKYDGILYSTGYYDYSTCAAGVSTPTVDTADLLQNEHVKINIKAQPIKIPVAKELNVH